MDSTDSWKNILSELDLTDHRQDLAAAGYDSFKALMNMPEADMDRFSFPLDSLIETQKVFQFLKGARLEKFAEKFIELGFSTMEDLKHMSDSDLLKCGVGQPGHQNRFASQKQQHFRPDHVEPLPVPSASMEGPSARQCHEVKVQEADEQAAASCDFHSMPSAEEVCPVQAAALPFSPPLRGSTGVFDQELDSLASSPLADDLDKLHLLAEHSPRKCDFKRKGLDLDCLAGVIEDSTDAVNATAGKNVILLMGSTGSGKTCFMHTLAGRELVRQSRDVNGQNQEVWEAKDPLEGFTIGHNKARSETRSLRALWLPEAKAVVVDAPGQLDTRASEIDIATSAVCHRIAEGCRMLRFVVLINCYTLQADRAGGLRRVAELVANVLPDLGKRREHPLAINFFFTHVEALNIQELTPETARGEVHHWLREVLDGSDETESLAALRWMRKSMDLYEKGTLRYRLVDVYNPEWATLREVRKAVIRFKAEYALGQEGGLIQANSVGAILMPASKVKIEYMLQASRDEARKVLEEATPEDVPMLRNLWKNVELVRDYLISLPSARIVRDEISNIFTRRFEVLWQDATALLRKLESDSEDFSELEADKLWNTICVMEGIASLGQGSGDCCFQNRLECSLDTCLARLKQVSVATDLATLPRTHEIIRWQSKINAWNAIKPDWAKQMSLLIEAHCEQAASEAKKVHELGNRVIVVARQENVKDIASEVDALDGWNMEEIFHESFDALQTQFQQVFENASELALSSVKAVLESPASTPKFDFTMLGEVATSIEESRSAWDGAEGVAPQTRARLATWHQHLRGAVTGWLSDLLEGSRVVLQTVAQLAAGNDDQETCPNSYEHC